MNKTDIANKTESARTNLSKKENRIYCAFITKNYDTLRSYFVFIGRKYCPIFYKKSTYSVPAANTTLLLKSFAKKYIFFEK